MPCASLSFLRSKSFFFSSLMFLHLNIPATRIEGKINLFIDGHKLNFTFYMQLFEILPKNSVSVERAKVSTTKYNNPDIAPNTVKSSLLQNFKNIRIRIMGSVSCITALVALNQPTRTGVKQNGGLIMYNVSTPSLPITVIFPMIKMTRHRLYFHRDPENFSE